MPRALPVGSQEGESAPSPLRVGGGAAHWKATGRIELRTSCDRASDPAPGAGLTSQTHPPCSDDARLALLERLVRQEQAAVRAFLRSLGVNDAWVDDLAQETFLTAYRKLDEFQADGDPGRWLRGIARRLAANELRKAGRRSRLLAGGLADLLVARAKPDSSPPATEWLEALRSCMQELPEAGRELLVRRYADGELAPAMASRLQTRADSLRQKLLRLRQLVKGCIERKTGESWR